MLDNIYVQMLNMNVSFACNIFYISLQLLELYFVDLIVLLASTARRMESWREVLYPPEQSVPRPT